MAENNIDTSNQIPLIQGLSHEESSDLDQYLTHHISINLRKTSNKLSDGL